MLMTDELKFEVFGSQRKTFDEMQNKLKDGGGAFDAICQLGGGNVRPSDRSANSPHVVSSSRSSDTCVKVKVLIQLVSSSKVIDYRL